MSGLTVVLSDGGLQLRPLRRRDGPAWVELRRANEDWLKPWEAAAAAPQVVGPGWAERHSLAAYVGMLRTQRAQQQAGSHLRFGMFFERQLCGQVNVGEIVRGAFNSGYLGYWVDAAVAGRGLAPTGVALVADYCFGVAGLHRLEANVRPENLASVRVMDKVGFVAEGRRRRYLAVDGDYRDHVGYALLAEDCPGGVLCRLRAAGHAQPTAP